MRRLGDTQAAHERLLALSDHDRLFVQRWVEMFDEKTPPLFRSTSVSEARIRDERVQARGFHQRLLADEAEDVSAWTEAFDSLLDAPELSRQIRSDPTGAADRLGNGFSAQGYHAQWLFRAHQALLPEVGGDFGASLSEHLQVLRAQASARPMTVAAPLVQRGYVPPGARIKAMPAGRLAEALVSARSRAKPAQAIGQWWVVEVRALDPAMAWALARETLTRAQRSTPRRSRPLEFGTTTVLVDDPLQRPQRQGYAFKPARNYRFPVPDWDEGFDRLAVAAEGSDPILAVLSGNLRAALQHLRDDDPEAAFDDVVKCLDITFEDCPRLPAEAADRSMKRFVLKSALLLSLNSPHECFRYLYQYLVLPSQRVEGGELIPGERRPERVWGVMQDAAQWPSVVARAPWDRLLDFRRRALLAELRNWSRVQPVRRAQYSWQLARAVRSRNELFHEGTPLADTHALAAVISALELNLGLRVYAVHSGHRFSQLVTQAEEQAAGYEAGRRTAPASVAVDGWHRWEGFLRGLKVELRGADAAWPI